MHDRMVTQEMYEAGLKYLTGKGTAWCVSDLFKAMFAAKTFDEIGTMVNHEQEPHCCGCWVIRYDNEGLNAVCNECGETRDLISILGHSSEKRDMPKAFARMPAGVLTRLIQYGPLEDADYKFLAALLDELTVLQ